MTPEQLTLFEAQINQPWSVPYADKHWVKSNDGQIKHAVLHAQKSLGKIATVLEALDHENRSGLTDEEAARVGEMCADLVSAALRLGNLTGRSIAHELMARAKEKNGNGYGEPLPPEQRISWALICRRVP